MLLLPHASHYVTCQPLAPLILPPLDVPAPGQGGAFLLRRLRRGNEGECVARCALRMRCWGGEEGVGAPACFTGAWGGEMGAWDRDLGAALGGGGKGPAFGGGAWGCVLGAPFQVQARDMEILACMTWP